MLVHDIMSTNVITIPSSISLAAARKIMEAHGFRRLPVVDKGKLVGIVTERRLETYYPTKNTPLNIWEVGHYLDNTPVREIMEKKVITVTPDMTAEESLALAQSNRVGALVVVEDSRVVGIITTNDFFYKIVNPVLGIGEPGYRIEIPGGGDPKKLEEILSIINNECPRITNLHIFSLPESREKNVIVHFNCDNVDEIKQALAKRGYTAQERHR